MCNFSGTNKNAVHRVSIIIATVLLIAATAPRPRASPTTDIQVTSEEINTIIRQYTSTWAVIQMPEWTKLIFHPDAAYRRAVLESLLASYRRFQNHDENLNKNLDAIIRRALAPYGKEYDLLVLNHSGPQMMHESYSTLIVTVGLLERVPSDDALVMFLYHEMAHDLFAEESTELKNRLAEFSKSGLTNTEEARRVAKRLMIVELKCDAAATRFALASGHNPAPFGQVIEQIYKDFPDETSRGNLFGFNIHPFPQLRRQVIESIAGSEALARRPYVSEELKAIKTIILLAGHQARTVL